ncbi:TerB N-terminal domain-containing protein [Pseudomonas cichorii]|uniref:tellurite resistance TerB family protein n=1 Tax=Pseudomonas cichorii TaxID=36746 RepID=UPI000F00BCBF|nr:TerB N-terminal domain-containing protein [Pseudomonas cichorii]
MAHQQRARSIGAGVVATILAIFVSLAAGLPAYVWIAFTLAVVAWLVVRAQTPHADLVAGPQPSSKLLTVEHSPYSRPSSNLVGGTQPYTDDSRLADAAEEELRLDSESLAIGRFARFSQPSTHLVGGTQPHPDDIRQRQWPTSSMDDPESFAIGRFARFSRPPTHLVGGTKPCFDKVADTSLPKPLPVTAQVKAPRGRPEFFGVHEESSSSRSFNIPKAPDRPGKSRWFGAGESVTVAGILLPGGLIYVGTNDAKFRLAEPSFIDTSLQVKNSPADFEARLQTYWLSYEILTPAARRGYLQWLASGRCAPGADIAYVLIFFYGLERRALMDTTHDAGAREEIPVIRAEVTRLRTLYGDDLTFRSYASRLLEHLNVGDISAQMYLHEPPTVSAEGYEMPLSVRVALGQMATDKHPLNASWALAWALSDPNISRRTPVFRCADQFQRLFQITYEKRFPRGLVLLNNKTRLKVAYRAASLHINVQDMSVGDLPDVTATSGTRKKLQIIVEECATVLDPFSRYLGRNPDNHDALEGLLQLPTFLWPEPARMELEALQSRVGHDAILITFGELAARFKSAGALSRDKVIALARALEALNIGMEPDVLSGSRIPKTEDNIVLFAAEPDDGTLRATAEYNAAVVTLDLASAVAAVDGETSQDEIALLGLHIDSWSHLCHAHRKRLKAHLQIQLQQPPTLASLKKKLDPLKQDEKRTIAGFLAHLAHADGTISPQEIKLLERVYKALQLDLQLLYSDLHGAAASPLQRSKSAGSSQANYAGVHGSSSPSRADTGTRKPGSGIVLDMNRVAQLQRETAEVSALLAKVFQEDQADEQVVLDELVQSAPEIGVHLYGLDAEHSAFLRLLVSRNEWSRQELENVAVDMELMLDGALEQINDMAFELFGMPISEGDDPVEINPDVLSELTL